MINFEQNSVPELTIIGGGLSGCEAAWQAAKRGIHVTLYEMRPLGQTGAHKTDHLAELVCSNSLGSDLLDRPAGLILAELKMLNSLLASAAEISRVPAGHALAVDREGFSAAVEERIASEPLIRVVRQEITEIPINGIVIIASGPLTSEKLVASVSRLTGKENLFFFDAIAPIVRRDSINFDKAFRASRYGKGESEEGDYINCPLSKDEYYTFVDALKNAERIPLKSYEQAVNEGVLAGNKAHFEGCLPVEVLADRNPEALAFGPMRPVGLWDPRTHQRGYAVLQLRQDDFAADLFNMVGFQTNLLYPEQKRVFSMIPGLERAEFVRYGQMHRNSYLSAPLLLNHFLQLKTDPRIFICGQLAGIEGYLGNIASGAAAGRFAANLLQNKPLQPFPAETMIGSLLNYISSADMKDFQPMKANFGILPPMEDSPRGKSERNLKYTSRALEEMKKFIGITETEAGNV